MTGFWHRSLLCVCVYRPRLHLGPSSRKREFNQSSLTIRLFSRAYVTKQKHFGRQDGFLHYYIEVINCIFFIAFVFKNASSDFDFNWSILNNILQNCDLPRLSYTINVLSGLSEAFFWESLAELATGPQRFSKTIAGSHYTGNWQQMLQLGGYHFMRY